MKNKIKSFFLVFLMGATLGLVFSHQVYAESSIKINWGAGSNTEIKSKMISGINDDIPVADLSKNTKDGDSFIPNLFKTLKSYIFSLVMIISVSMLVWIGIRIASARGNPDEFKKAWKHLLYLIIGIFFIFTAWGIVRLVATFNIF